MVELVRRGRRVERAPISSVVICVMDRVDDLVRCLTSLQALPRLPAHEVVIVGNGTSASALASLPSPDDLVIAPSPVNLGFGGGCNWGARFARGQHLVFLNDDTEVEQGWLAALVEVAESDPRIGIVGSRLLDPDGTLQEAGSVLWSDAGTHQVGKGLPPGSAAYDRIREVDYCSACGLLVTRSAWESVGGFDEAYFPAYHEDVDLCLSVRAQGFRVVYAPEARLRHRGGGSLPAELRTRVGLRSGRYFIAKWRNELRGYEAPPQPPSLPGVVAAAIERAQRRPLPPLRPAEAPTVSARAPTQVDALQAQIRALGAAQSLHQDLVRELLARPDREQVPSNKLRHIGRRLPLARKLRAWVSQ